MNLTLDYRLDN